MSNLSRSQFDALVALIPGPKVQKALAVELGLRTHIVNAMMRPLADRGLVRLNGRLNNYTYTLTAAGRLQVEAAKDNAAIDEAPAFVGSVDELAKRLDGGKS